MKAIMKKIGTISLVCMRPASRAFVKSEFEYHYKNDIYFLLPEQK